MIEHWKSYDSVFRWTPWAQLLSEIQPFEVREIATFFAKNQYFWYKCWNFSGTVRNIKKRFSQGCTATKMLLRMGLYDSLGQRGAGLEIFQYYSDFLTKLQYFWRLCWNFSETVRNIKKQFELGCRNSKVLLRMCLQDSVYVGQNGTCEGFQAVIRLHTLKGLIIR